MQQRYEFWYLLGLLEEAITGTLPDGQVDLGLIRRRLASFEPQQHDGLVESLEIAVVGLHFTEEFLTNPRVKRFFLRPRRLARDLPRTPADVHDLLAGIADSVERAGTHSEHAHTIMLPKSTTLEDAASAVRNILSIIETAVGMLGRSSKNFRTAAAGRIGSLSRDESERLLWAAHAIEAAIALVLIELEKSLDV